MATAGTPAAVIQRIHRDSVNVLKLPDVVARLDQLGMDPIGNSPDAFAREIQREAKLWSELIRARKLKAE